MTPLSLTAPLASMLDTARKAGLVSSQQEFGARRTPPVDQGCVARTISRGDAVELSTLAAYARGLGWSLWVATGKPGEPTGERRIRERGWNVTADGRASGVGVGELREALEGLGMVMVLAVEMGAGEHILDKCGGHAGANGQFECATCGRTGSLSEFLASPACVKS
jgi:hypothetical protein